MQRSGKRKQPQLLLPRFGSRAAAPSAASAAPAAPAAAAAAAAAPATAATETATGAAVPARRLPRGAVKRSRSGKTRRAAPPRPPQPSAPTPQAATPVSARAEPPIVLSIQDEEKEESADAHAIEEEKKNQQPQPQPQPQSDEDEQEKDEMKVEELPLEPPQQQPKPHEPMQLPPPLPSTPPPSPLAYDELETEQQQQPQPPSRPPSPPASPPPPSPPPPPPPPITARAILYDEVVPETPPKMLTHRGASQQARLEPQQVAYAPESSAVVSQHQHQPQHQQLRRHSQTRQQTTPQAPLTFLLGWAARDDEGSAGCELAALDIPSSLLERFRLRGITGLHAWQVRCLSAGGAAAWRGANLVYSAPTGGGKTLVAELLVLRHILLSKERSSSNSPVLWAVPLKAIADELGLKLSYLLDGFAKVQVLHSGDAGARLSSSVDLIICTAERANVIVNTQLRKNARIDLGMVVVDEVHSLGEKDVPERLLTKVNFYNRHRAMGRIVGDGTENAPPAGTSQEEDEEGTQVLDRETTGSDHVQIVAFSATMPNCGDIARWNNAVEFVSNVRTTALHWMVLENGQKDDRADFVLRRVRNPFSASGEIDEAPALRLPHHDASRAGNEHSELHAVHALCRDSFAQQRRVLVFCGTRTKVEDTSRDLTAILRRHGHPLGEASADLRDRRQALVRNMCLASGRENAILCESMPAGVGFHHAGLMQEEKRMVEDAFRCGTLDVLFATTSVAAGVNLPADRVVMMGLLNYGTSHYSHVQLQQMGGRSGRQGECESSDGGDVVILLNGSSTRRSFEERFLTKPLPNVSSTLLRAGRPLRVDWQRLESFLLEAICLGLASERVSFQTYVQSTFAFHDGGSAEAHAALEAAVDEAVANLAESDKKRPLVKYFPASEAYLPTSLGKAAVAASLASTDARILQDDIVASQDSLMLQSLVQLIWLVVPSGSKKPAMTGDGWACFADRMMNGDAPECDAWIAVADAVLPERWRGRLQTLGGRRDCEKSDPWGLDSKLKRLCLATVLQAIIDEDDYGWWKSTRWRIEQQHLSSLLVEAAEQCTRVIIFCRELGHQALLNTLKPLRDRLQYGLKHDLIRLRCLTSEVSVSLVRHVFESGFKTLDSFLRPGALDDLAACLAKRRQGYYAHGGGGGGNGGGYGRGGEYNAVSLDDTDRYLAKRIISAARGNKKTAGRKASNNATLTAGSSAAKHQQAGRNYSNKSNTKVAK